MIASSGDRLLEPPAVEAYETELFPLAALITPNLDEAAWLLETKIKDRQSMEKAVRELAKKYRVSVLLKGGHIAGSAAVDLLFAGNKLTEFSAPFVRGVATARATARGYNSAILRVRPVLVRTLQLQRVLGSCCFRLFFAAAAALTKDHAFPNRLHDKRLFVRRTTL